MENTIADKNEYRKYWKMVRTIAREKTNKKLGIGIRILAIAIGIISTTLVSILLGGNLMTILSVALVTFIVTVTLWIIVWFGVFVYYRAYESVIAYQEKDETIKKL